MTREEAEHRLYEALFNEINNDLEGFLPILRAEPMVLEIVVCKLSELQAELKGQGLLPEESRDSSEPSKAN